jgi:hypothetical protein
MQVNTRTGALTDKIAGGTILLFFPLRRCGMHSARAILLRRGIPLIAMLLVQACNLSLPGSGSGGGLLTPTNTAFEPDASGGPVPSATPTETPAVPTATPTETPIPLVYPVGPSGFPTNVNPLTGLLVENMQLLDRRPLAIKVSNFPYTARPQRGLSCADILWEFYTEFGNTRWIAMFYGRDAEEVGPIRSARVMDTRIVPHYSAILVHVQAFETVWEEMSKTGIDYINEFPASCPAICRDPEVTVVENSAFGNTAELTKFARRVGYLSAGRPNLDGMIFDPAVPAAAEPSLGARIYLSSLATAEWKYDSAAGRYLRNSETQTGALQPLTDQTTGEQLAVDNVLVLVVDIFHYVGQKGKGEMFDMDLSGSGKGYFFRDGVMLQGKWRSGGPNSPLQFVDADENAYALHPGTTYIAVVGKLSTGARAATSEWYFSNRL